MDENFLYAFLLTLFAGLSTALGSLIAFFSHKNSDRVLSFGLGFSGGVMVYISFMEILPKSIESFVAKLGSLGEGVAIIFFFVGFTLSFIIDRMIPDDVNPHEMKNYADLKPIRQDRGANLKRMGVFTAIAIGIHNFPEGFATFVAALEEPKIGVIIAVAVALHNIPEGVSVSLPIYQATGNKRKAFIYSATSGLAEPLGALLGFFLLAPLLGDYTLGVMFALVAGIMIYISFDELIPSARVYGSAHTTIAGVATGMGLMAFSLVFMGLL